jgi:excisionase family DNA binding protein
MSYVSLERAAKLLLVSQSTVLKWIHQNRLQARKTADKRYLVSRDSVTEFLNTSLPLIEEIVDGSRPIVPCWEYNSEDGITDACLSCLVFQSGEGKCYRMGKFLKESGQGATCCPTDCEDCSYYKYHQQMSKGQLFSSAREDLKDSETQNSN